MIDVIERHVWISGRVQGVGFRRFVLKRAQTYLGLKGYVKNLPDGRVEVVILGSEKSVLSLVSDLREGPPHSGVSTLEVKEETPRTDLKEFQIELG
jgi:acylphosphatase